MGVVEGRVRIKSSFTTPTNLALLYNLRLLVEGGGVGNEEDVVLDRLVLNLEVSFFVTALFEKELITYLTDSNLPK